NLQDVRLAIVLGYESVRKPRSIEIPVASEVLPERGAVQKSSGRLESLRCSEDAIDGDASSLLHRLSGRVEDFHERDGAGGDAHGGFHEVALRSEPREAHPSAPA